MKLLTSLDLTQNELQNAAVQQLAADPGSPVEGQVWVNTTQNRLKLFRGGGVKVLLESGAVVNADIAGGAAIDLAKLATNPLARANHTGTQLASTISDFDTQVRVNRLDQLAAPTAAVSMNGQRLTGLANEAAATDAMNRDSVRAQRLDQFAAPTADVALNGQKITGAAEPSGAQDYATKAYVDATRAGLDLKDSVRAATTANLDLSGDETIDGVDLDVGDRVLVKNQTAPAENGIYVVAAGAWTRAPDANASGEVTPGLFTFVEAGTTQADSGWVLTTNAPIVLDTTGLTFAQFSAAGSITAGAGLTQTGSTFDVNPDGSTIEVVGDQVRVKAGGITGNELGAASVDLPSGDVTGTLPVGKGGTNATTAAAARTSLGATGKAAGDVVGDGADTTLDFAHNLGTTDIIVQVYEATTDELVGVDIDKIDANTVRLTFGTAPANGKTYRVVVIG